MQHVDQHGSIANATIAYWYHDGRDTAQLQFVPIGTVRSPFEHLQRALPFWAMEDYLFTQDGFACSPLVLIYSVFAVNSFAQMITLQKAVQSLSEIDPRSVEADSIRDLSQNIRRYLMHLQYVAQAYLHPIPANSRVLLSTRFRQMPAPLESIQNIVTRTRDLYTQLSETLQNIANTATIETGNMTLKHAEDAKRQADEAQKQAEQALKQTRQGLFLTRLAAIYLPLSLASSVFSMQLGEFDSSKPRWWMFFITSMVLMIVTMLVLKVGGGDQGSEVSWKIWRTWLNCNLNTSKDGQPRTDGLPVSHRRSSEQTVVNRPITTATKPDGMLYHNWMSRQENMNINRNDPATIPFDPRLRNKDVEHGIFPDRTIPPSVPRPSQSAVIQPTSTNDRVQHRCSR